MKKLIAYIFILFTVFACKHKTDEFDGPDLNDLYGEFYVITPLTPSGKSINFSTGEDLVINAELSKRTPWIIEITGLSSGAVATIEGTDRLLASNNATWLGGANNFPGFGIEDAEIKLSFPDQDAAYTMYDTISIEGGKIDKGFLITSFENGFGAEWERFNQTTVAGNIICGDGKAGKGDCYYSFNGTVGWDWAIGNVVIKPGVDGFGLPNNGNNLYFNVGMKPVESIGDQSSFLLATFREDDNEDGIFDPNTEDAYSFEEWTTDDAWTVVNRLYNDLQFDADGNKIDVAGNGLPEPSKIIEIELFYLANPNNGNAQALFDHIIFTQNEPYRP